MLPVISLGILLAVWPSYLTVSVAGMSAESRQITQGCWHDPKTGYYLYKGIECDGAHASITLTKDRRMVSESGFKVPSLTHKQEYFRETQVDERPIQLSTKNSVRIGMSRDEVLHRLGKPVLTAVRGKNSEYWCALYKKVNRKDELMLRNTYIFKHGKLIEISVNLDSIGGGCGADPDSDEGWPWSKF